MQDDLIGQLLAAFTLKLDRESQLMKLLHPRTPVQKRRKGLQHMDHILQYEDHSAIIQYTKELAAKGKTIQIMYGLKGDAISWKVLGLK